MGLFDDVVGGIGRIGGEVIKAGIPLAQQYAAAVIRRKTGQGIPTPTKSAPPVTAPVMLPPFYGTRVQASALPGGSPVFTERPPDWATPLAGMTSQVSRADVLGPLLAVGGSVVGENIIKSTLEKLLGMGEAKVAEPTYAGPVIPQGQAPMVGQGVGQPFRVTAAGRLAAQTFWLANPMTGSVEWFRPAGRFLIGTRDVGNFKRMQKTVRKLRSLGGRLGGR